MGRRGAAWGDVERRGTTWDDVGRRGTTWDDVVRLGLLMEACTGIDVQLPMKMPPMEPGGPEVLHFFGSPEELEKVKQSDKGYDLTKTGLSEYCDAFVEEFEEELVGVMDAAKPYTDSVANSMGKAIPRFELKEDICVKTTKMCTQDMLNRLSYHRIAQADPGRMGDQMGDLLKYLKKTMPDAPQKSKTKLKTPDGIEATVTASEPQDLPKNFQGGKSKKAAGGGMSGMSSAKKGKKKSESVEKEKEGENHESVRPTVLGMVDRAVRKLISASIYVQVGVLALTALSVYIGGQVARIW